MFCYQCGEKLIDGAKFCSKCGTKAAGSIKDMPVQSATTQKVPTQPVTPQKATAQSVIPPKAPTQYEHQQPPQPPNNELIRDREPDHPVKKREPFGIIFCGIGLLWLFVIT